uniref:Uncharacterized protein n=1 Tax=Knipowitschia caucasica TaxID=637954 RepID=A0AAV2MSG8_KNICA
MSKKRRLCVWPQQFSPQASSSDETHIEPTSFRPFVREANGFIPSYTAAPTMEEIISCLRGRRERVRHQLDATKVQPITDAVSEVRAALRRKCKNEQFCQKKE